MSYSISYTATNLNPEGVRRYLNNPAHPLTAARVTRPNTTIEVRSFDLRDHVSGQEFVGSFNLTQRLFSDAGGAQQYVWALRAPSGVNAEPVRNNHLPINNLGLYAFLDPELSVSGVYFGDVDGDENHLKDVVITFSDRNGRVVSGILYHAEARSDPDYSF